jgi:peptidoglycan/xylan/chitin deacetylase (PgdA/CDA1 family)
MLLKMIGVSAVAASLRYPWWRNSITTSRPRILMYHMVAPHVRGGSLNKWRIDPKDFAAQMRWLAQQGWRSVTMTELMASSGAETVPCDKMVAVTFDDGFSQIYDVALPILKEYNIKSTLYLLTGEHENGWDAGKEVRRESLLSASQIETMMSTGLFELAGHGVQHVNLTTLSEQQVVDQAGICRSTLQKCYGVSCNSFAYPFGQVNDAVVASVRACGYQHAVIVGNRIMDSYRDDPFMLPRLTMDGRRASMIDFYLQMTRGRCK